MSAKMIDISGQRFGRLVAIKSTSDEKGRFMWKCRCDCGNTHLVKSVNLRRGTTRSCGCLAKETAYLNGKRNLKNLTGQKFGRLIAVELMPVVNKSGNAIWRCKCDCSKMVLLSSSQLVTKHTKSCGCLRTAQRFIGYKMRSFLKPEDIPIGLIKTLQASYDLRKAIKEAS